MSGRRVGAAGLRRPEPFLEMPSPPRTEFETWLKLFRAYMSVANGDSGDETRRCSLFVISLGIKGFWILGRRPGEKGDDGRDDSSNVGIL